MTQYESWLLDLCVIRFGEMGPIVSVFSQVQALAQVRRDLLIPMFIKCFTEFFDYYYYIFQIKEIISLWIHIYTL